MAYFTHDYDNIFQWDSGIKINVSDSIADEVIHFGNNNIPFVSVKTSKEALTAMIDATIFVEKTGRHLGESTFIYSETAWKLAGNEVSLADYGIVISGTPSMNDTIVAKKERLASVEIIDGTAEIPNQLLVEDGDLYIYAYLQDENEGKTLLCETMKIVGRPVPPEYVVTNSKTITYPALTELVTAMESIKGMLKGGSTNQVLAKNSDSDFDYKWVTGGGGGAIYGAGDGIDIDSDNSISVKYDGESIVLNADGKLEANVDVPTKTSELQNDSGFITSASVPTKTSELTNDSGFITSAYHDSTKADVSTTYTKTEVDTALSGKGNLNGDNNWSGVQVFHNDETDTDYKIGVYAKDEESEVLFHLAENTSIVTNLDEETEETFDTLYTGDISASGNISAFGTLSASDGQFEVDTNGNVSAEGNVSADGNVTAKGNVSADGNVSANNVSATGNVTADCNVSANNVSASTCNISHPDYTAIIESGVDNDEGYITINADRVLIGGIHAIKRGDDTYLTKIYTPTDNTDAANKAYVDVQVATREASTNKVTTISSTSTDTEYPSAKCVYDIVGNVEALLEAML